MQDQSKVELCTQKDEVIKSKFNYLICICYAITSAKKIANDKLKHKNETQKRTKTQEKCTKTQEKHLLLNFRKIIIIF
jgi:hypothetical protein